MKAVLVLSHKKRKCAHQCGARARGSASPTKNGQTKESAREAANTSGQRQASGSVKKTAQRSPDVSCEKKNEEPARSPKDDKKSCTRHKSR